MGSYKTRIEQGFEHLTELIYRFRWGVIGLMILLAIGAVRQLPHLTIDMSDEGFLHADDPILQTYNDFRDQFGRDDLIVLAIESDQIFQQSFLRKLKQLHEALEDNVPHLDEIISMVNARNTRGVTDGIIVEDLLEHWPEDKQSLNELKKRVMENPLYRDRLISRDGRFTTLIIKTDAYSSAATDSDVIADGFDDPDMLDPELQEPTENHDTTQAHTYISEEERSAIVLAVNTIAAGFQSEDFTIHLAGSPVVTNSIKTSMRADMMLFLRLAVLAIALCLFLMFRRISAVIYPLMVVILALISTMATMSLLGVAIKMPT
ncbi:MMPL family transporter, partial [Thermodesulfobacteriota bacterium]